MAETALAGLGREARSTRPAVWRIRPKTIKKGSCFMDLYLFFVGV